MSAMRAMAMILWVGTMAWGQPATAPADVVAGFLAQCAARSEAAEKAGNLTVLGRDGWMFFAPELRHLSVGTFWGPDAARVSRASRPQNADPLPVIVDFAAQLKAAGIELLFVPVPAKAAVYPDMLSDKVRGPLPRVDTAHAAFYEALRNQGVQVLDIQPALAAARADAGSPPVYCRQDTHWSPYACQLVARLIAERIGSRPWLKDLPRLRLQAQEAEMQITGDLWRNLKADAPPKETLKLRTVAMQGGGTPEPVKPDATSPIILLGDSHTLVFSIGEELHGTGAGLADQLALELGVAVDLIGVRGSGATPSRVSLYQRSKSNADYLKTKKLVIWCLSVREFTESTNGWQKLPIAPKVNQP